LIIIATDDDHAEHTAIMTEFEPLVFPKTHFKKNFGFSMDFGEFHVTKLLITTMTTTMSMMMIIYHKIPKDSV
jgi:hypothetical protein